MFALCKHKNTKNSTRRTNLLGKFLECTNINFEITCKTKNNASKNFENLR